MSVNVLIVDDSPVMRTFVRRVIELSGFAVNDYLEASDGQEALGVLEREKVDVVVTDINMPNMDGEQLVQRVEQDAALRLIPVVVVSTDQTDSRVQRMLTLGARGYVKKPFQPEDLRAELEAVLGGSYAG